MSDEIHFPVELTVILQEEYGQYFFNTYSIKKYFETLDMFGLKKVIKFLDDIGTYQKAYLDYDPKSENRIYIDKKIIEINGYKVPDKIQIIVAYE